MSHTQLNNAQCKMHTKSIQLVLTGGSVLGWGDDLFGSDNASPATPAEKIGQSSQTEESWLGKLCSWYQRCSVVRALMAETGLASYSGSHSFHAIFGQVKG